MLYHVSNVSGIKLLKPGISTHKKAYVYAVDNIATGLLFGAPHDDFDFMISTEGNGKPVVFEGMTNWDAELVCEKEVPVQREIYIKDLYGRLLEEEARGNLIIHKYQDSMEYKKIISEHIVDRLIRFDALGCIETDMRFQKYYKGIIDALLSIMDGHLL